MYNWCCYAVILSVPHEPVAQCGQCACMLLLWWNICHIESWHVTKLFHAWLHCADTAECVKGNEAGIQPMCWCMQTAEVCRVVFHLLYIPWTTGSHQTRYSPGTTGDPEGQWMNSSHIHCWSIVELVWASVQPGNWLYLLFSGINQKLRDQCGV